MLYHHALCRQRFEGDMDQLLKAITQELPADHLLGEVPDIPAGASSPSESDLANHNRPPSVASSKGATKRK
jgi:hypothetical protein